MISAISQRRLGSKVFTTFSVLMWYLNKTHHLKLNSSACATTATAKNVLAAAFGSATSYGTVTALCLWPVTSTLLKNDKTERARGLGSKSKRGDPKMTALRFQTGARHQTSPASLRGYDALQYQAGLQKSYLYNWKRKALLLYCRRNQQYLFCRFVSTFGSN